MDLPRRLRRRYPASVGAFDQVAPANRRELHNERGRAWYNRMGPLRVPKEATMVELEIYFMGEPTGAKITIDPASVQDVQELPGKPRARMTGFGPAFSSKTHPRKDHC